MAAFPSTLLRRARSAPRWLVIGLALVVVASACADQTDTAADAASPDQIAADAGADGAETTASADPEAGDPATDGSTGAEPEPAADADPAETGGDPAADTDTDTDAADADPAADTDGGDQALIGSIFVDGCQTDPQPITVLGIEFAPLDPAVEAEIGQSLAQQILDTSVVSNDPERNALLDALLADVVPADRPFEYDVYLVETTEINAFALPGGQIFFTTALMDFMETEDQLAFIMAHEVAHIVCRHGAEQIERQALAIGAIESLAGDEMTAEAIYLAYGDSIVNALQLLVYSRDDEREADLVALDLLQAAGRSTDGAASSLELLLALEGDVEDRSTIEALFDTHPPTQERIDAINEALAEG